MVALAVGGVGRLTEAHICKSVAAQGTAYPPMVYAAATKVSGVVSRPRDKYGPDIIGAGHYLPPRLMTAIPAGLVEVRFLLLDPPGWHRLWSPGLPHWPYVQAVDRALTNRAIPPASSGPTSPCAPTTRPTATTPST
jgi:hypothetical protein